MSALRPLHLAPLLIAAAAIAGAAAAFYFSPPHLAGTIPDRARLAQLQDLADEACSCLRKEGKESARKPCSAKFDSAVAPYEPGDMSTACGPMSGDWKCFGGNCEGATVLVSRPGGACNADEERILEAIWSHEGGDESDAGWTRGLAAMDRAHQAFRRGEKVTAPPVKSGGGGC